jgi:hypothetical protein
MMVIKASFGPLPYQHRPKMTRRDIYIYFISWAIKGFCDNLNRPAFCSNVEVPYGGVLLECWSASRRRSARILRRLKATFCSHVEAPQGGVLLEY